MGFNGKLTVCQTIKEMLCSWPFQGVMVDHIKAGVDSLGKPGNA